MAGVAVLSALAGLAACGGEGDGASACGPESPRELRLGESSALHLADHLDAAALEGGARGPRRVGVELKHPAHPDARERREAVAVPADSALCFRVRVPEAGALSLGYGLAPGGEAQAFESVVFRVAVQPEGAGARVVHEDRVDPRRRRGWTDAEIDLGRRAGQSVAVTLRTAGFPSTPPGDAPGARSGSGRSRAFWSGPVLYRGDRAGRLVVLVGIDTLPAARTSTYGYERETTPQLTRIAAQGIRFTRALSPSPWTRPAFASIFTGLPPARHRAGEPGPGGGPETRPLAPGFATLAERLRGAGWRTRAWINNPYLVAGSGLEQGFASYVDYGTRSSVRAAEPAVREVVRELAEPQGADRFLFLHLMDPHGAYRMPDDFLERFAAAPQVGRLSHPLGRWLFGKLTRRLLDPTAEERRFLSDLYAAAVAYTDAQVGHVFDAALAAGPPERLTFVVTADHGEELFEHGGFEHGHTVYDELLRVPLVVVQPGRTPAGGTVETPVSTRDLASTLLAAAGVGALPPGRSLLPLLDEAQPADGRAVRSSATLYGVERLAIERDRLKYIYNQTANGKPSRRAPRPEARHELYDLRRDPGETASRFRSEPERARALHAELAEQFVESLAGSVAVGFDAGSGAGEAPPVLEGFLTLPPGQRFSARVRDYVWPLADGSDAELEIHWDWVFGRHRMRFRTRAPRGVLGFPLPQDAGPVRARFLLDGKPVPAEAIAVGAQERRPGGTHFEVRAEDSLPVEEVLREREDGDVGLRIAVGQVPVFPELLDGEAAPPDPDLREQLEALGYLE